MPVFDSIATHKYWHYIIGEILNKYWQNKINVHTYRSVIGYRKCSVDDLKV